MVTAKAKSMSVRSASAVHGDNVAGASQRRRRIEAGEGIEGSPLALLARENVEADVGERRSIGGERRVALMYLGAGGARGIGDLRVFGGDEDAREATAFGRRLDRMRNDRAAKKRQDVLTWQPFRAAARRDDGKAPGHCFFSTSVSASTTRVDVAVAHRRKQRQRQAAVVLGVGAGQGELAVAVAVVGLAVDGDVVDLGADPALAQARPSAAPRDPATLEVDQHA